MRWLRETGRRCRARHEPAQGECSMSRRVLFAAPVQPIGGCSANVYSWDKPPGALRIAMSFLNHPGLAFLAANLPCTILEYPTWEDYRRALAQRPDVVGLSFYINETEL